MPIKSSSDILDFLFVKSLIQADLVKTSMRHTKCLTPRLKEVHGTNLAKSAV